MIGLANRAYVMRRGMRRPGAGMIAVVILVHIVGGVDDFVDVCTARIISQRKLQMSTEAQCSHDTQVHNLSIHKFNQELLSYALTLQLIIKTKIPMPSSPFRLLPPHKLLQCPHLFLQRRQP